MKKLIAIFILTSHVANTHCIEPISATLAAVAVVDLGIRGVNKVWSWWKGGAAKDDPTQKALETAEKKNTTLQQEALKKQQEIIFMEQRIKQEIAHKEHLEKERKAIEADMALQKKLLYICYKKCLTLHGTDGCTFILDTITAPTA